MDTFQDSDDSLLQRMAAGDGDAFTAIFNRYWDKVYSTALLLTKMPEQAEDISQEVFLRLWQNRDRAGEIEKPEAYLFIICRNLIYTRMSRIKTEDAYRHYLLQAIPPAGAQPDAITEANQLMKTIQNAIQQLPPQQQKAFRLSREKGMTHEEISEAMNISRRTVKNYIVQAIATLRKQLEGQALFIFILLYRIF